MISESKVNFLHSIIIEIAICQPIYKHQYTIHHGNDINIFPLMISHKIMQPVKNPTVYTKHRMAKRNCCLDRFILFICLEWILMICFEKV
jgi:hypothetical protein